jgi:hypothetical protein
MPRDPFADLHHGEKIPGLPHEVWNKILRLLRAKPAAGGGGWEPSAVEFNVRNVSGSPLTRGNICRLAGATSGAASEDNLFGPDLQDVATPIAGKPFAVVTQPASVNGIGRARALGRAVCKVSLTSTAHHYARVTSSATQLASDGDGPARILWVESDLTGTRATGSQWAVVLLTAVDPETAVVFVTSTSATNDLYPGVRVVQIGGRANWPRVEVVWVESMNGNVLQRRNYIGRKGVSKYQNRDVYAVDFCCGDTGTGSGPPPVGPGDWTPDPDPFPNLTDCWACGGTGTPYTRYLVPRRLQVTVRPTTPAEWQDLRVPYPSPAAQLLGDFFCLSGTPGYPGFPATTFDADFDGSKWPVDVTINPSAFCNFSGADYDPMFVDLVGAIQCSQSSPRPWAGGPTIGEGLDYFMFGGNSTHAQPTGDAGSCGWTCAGVLYTGTGGSPQWTKVHSFSPLSATIVISTTVAIDIFGPGICVVS